MKKLIYVAFCVLMTHFLHAQHAADKNEKLNKIVTKISDQSYKTSLHNEVITPADHESFYKTGSSRAGGDFVGNTTYDLPTNGTSPGRLLVYEDGTASVVYTGSTSLSDARPDRGTFYNSYDGSTWGPAPDTRIEDIRTGFPAIVNVGDHEMYFAHDGTNNIAIFENDAPGSNSWTENANSLLIHGSWPRAAVADGSDYVHLLVANDDDANKNDYMIYYRSPDGGATWDINGLRLPGIDTANGYSIMGAECYVIRAIGSDVYIVAGNSINDLAVWKSTSNGDVGSWTRTRLIEFPMPNFNGNTISDITGDGVADTMYSHDGCLSLAIDNSGMMHVWTGVTRILDIEADDDAWSYFPGYAGMWYWNETFGADSVQYLDFPLVDWDNDGDPFAGIGADLPNYGCGFNSMPAATVDPITGNIYVVYTQEIEYTDYFGDPTISSAQSFRDIFGFYTTDNGMSWSTPINLTYLAEQNFENINPTVYWSTIDNKVHTLWMQDMEPGSSLENEAPDPITSDNDIIYRAYDYSRFEAYDPTADYSYNTVNNVVTYDNISVDASDYAWSFGDGLSSNLKDPVHIYTAIGTYNVCLTATNVYGDDVNCKNVEITQLTNVDDISLEKNITVYPTLTTGNISIHTNDLIDDLQLEIYNLQGQLIYSKQIQTNDEQISLSGQASGEYLLKFVSHSAVTIKQVSLVN